MFQITVDSDSKMIFLIYEPQWIALYAYVVAVYGLEETELT